MRIQHKHIKLLLTSLILSSCATQEPAPVEFGTGLGSSLSASRSHSSKSEKVSSKRFDFEDSSSENEKKSETQVDKREDSNQEHVLRDKRKKEEPKYIKEDESEDDYAEKPKKKIETKKEDLESELDSVNEEKKPIKPQEKKEVQEEAKPEPTKVKRVVEEKEESTTEASENKEEERIVIDEQPDLQPKPEVQTGFVRPVNGEVIAKFGDLVNGAKNSGVNFAGDSGDPVYAVASGTIVHVGLDGKFGNIIIIKHNNSDIQTAYAHLSNAKVSKGQVIARGEQIGTLGQTGEADRPMLHFAVREGKVAVDPMKYLK